MLICGIILLLLARILGQTVVFGGVRRFAITVGLIINFNYMMECVAAGFR